MYKEIFTFGFMKQLRSNYSLLPLVSICGLTVSMFTMTIGRNLRKSPDIVVDRRHHPKPWQDYVDNEGHSKQYKYYSRIDYSKLKLDEDRPVFKLEWH